MRHLYTFLLYLITPFIVLALYWRGRRSPAYKDRILERFCLGSKEHTPVDVWIHAVSLGEAVAASPLIDALLANHRRVLVTTMTPTGSQHVIRRFGQQVAHQYLPYDLPLCLRWFFKKYTPRVGIIMETEMWPNVINQARRMKVPLMLANARLSDKAIKQYVIISFMFKPILNQLTAILAQSDEDAKRFMALGAASNLVHVLGNMKFDLQLQISVNKECMQLKEKWGRERTVVIAASTHDGEEKQLLSRLTQLKAAIPDVLLLFAPRHPERFQEVYQMSCALGFKTGQRSQPVTIDANSDVIIIDSLGELLTFYQMSDYAFVGGSLVRVGGHNVLEPIAVQVPVFCGPYMHNSKAICNELRAAGALVMVENADELIKALVAMHHNKSQRQKQIANASAVLEVNRGAVARCLERIEVILGA